MGRFFHLYLTTGLIALGLNYAWERAQAWLYEGVGYGWSGWIICFKAALGDVLMVWFVLLTISAAARRLLWLRQPRWLAAGILLGAIVAIAFELYSMATQRWAYSEWMPTVGGVGVLPVLQMMFLPVASYWLADRWITRRMGQPETS